jgi:hypothetical protein
MELESKNPIAAGNQKWIFAMTVEESELLWDFRNGSDRFLKEGL